MTKYPLVHSQQSHLHDFEVSILGLDKSHSALPVSRLLHHRASILSWRSLPKVTFRDNMDIHTCAGRYPDEKIKELS